jgi:hypothetical protein
MGVKMLSSYVIGGGLVGVIAGYITSSTVISPTFEPKILGPVWLYVSRSSTVFLEKFVGIKPKIKLVKMCAIDDKNVYAYPTLEIKMKYAEKVWGDENAIGGVMAKGNWNIAVFDVNLTHLYQFLAQQVDKIYGTVVSIDPDVQIIRVQTNSGEFKTLEYSELISTIPLPTLYELIDAAPEYEFEYKVIYGDLRTKKSAPAALNKYQVAYDISKSHYYRHTLISSDFVFSESVVRGKLKLGWKIKNIVGLSRLDGIKLVGRYARWIPKYFIHNALEDLGVK